MDQKYAVALTGGHIVYVDNSTQQQLSSAQFPKNWAWLAGVMASRTPEGEAESMQINPAHIVAIWRV